MDKKLEELTKPLVEYLKKNLHPHASILVTYEQVQVVETTLSIPND